MDKEKITLIVAGDVMLRGEDTVDIFENVADVLRSGDITFVNCEQTYSDKGYNRTTGTPGSDPTKSIETLINAGIDVFSLANNHTLDMGIEALLDTIERFSKTNVKIVGVGKNLEEARKPVIFEKKGNKVGFLAYGCTGPDGYEAWEDKPGYAPTRAYTIYEKWDYQPATPPRIISVAYPDDLAAMQEDVSKLKSQVDVVAVSFHWGLHFQPEKIPMYGFQVGHAAVDAGADLILGGHDHVLKGIEVYKGKVIFYALNNFAFGMGRHVPREESSRLAYGARMFQEMYNFEPDPGTIWHPDAKRTIIGKVMIEGGVIQKVSYLPCYINYEKGAQPEIVTRSDPRGEEVFNYMGKITRSQKMTTKFTWEGDEIVISQ